MIGVESILPPEETVESTVTEFAPMLHDYLDDVKARSPLGDVIDWSLASSTLATVYALADCMGPGSPEEKDSLTRGMYFARQVLAEIYCGEAGVLHLQTPGYFYDSSLQTGQIPDRIAQDAQEFLGGRPQVDALVGYYMPELDVHGRFAAHVEKASGFIFRLGETAVAERYLAERLEACTVQDFLS